MRRGIAGEVIAVPGTDIDVDVVTAPLHTCAPGFGHLRWKRREGETTGEEREERRVESRKTCGKVGYRRDGIGRRGMQY